MSKDFWWALRTTEARRPAPPSLPSLLHGGSPTHRAWYTRQSLLGPYWLASPFTLRFNFSELIHFPSTPSASGTPTKRNTFLLTVVPIWQFYEAVGYPRPFPLQFFQDRVFWVFRLLGPSPSSQVGFTEPFSPQVNPFIPTELFPSSSFYPQILSHSFQLSRASVSF